MPAWQRSESRAAQQTNLTQSEINIEIQANTGRSLQEAAKIMALAEAEAEKEARVGMGKAIAIEQQVKAYGGPQVQSSKDQWILLLTSYSGYDMLSTG